MDLTPERALDEMATKGEGSGICQMQAMAGLCNAAEFDALTMNLPVHERVVHGDATDQAILRFSETLGSIGDLRRQWKKTNELAFNSKNKFMIRTFQLAEPGGLRHSVSPEEALQFRHQDM
jgi:magnesium-transporting ATPase (P-type)